MIINAGIDAGYSTYQGMSKLAEVKFDAYIQKVDESDFKDIRTKINSIDQNNLLVKYNDSYYVIGRLAIKHYSTLIKKISVVRDETETKAMYATCLGLLCENKNFDVNLSVGTPNRSREDKERLQTTLKDKYEITYFTKDEELKKTINVIETFAMSQPMACCFILDEEVRDNSNIIVLDIGHGTADTMYIESGLHISNVAGMKFNTRGMEKVYKMMRDALLKSDI